MHAIALEFGWAQESLAHGSRGTAWWARLPARLRGWACTMRLLLRAPGEAGRGNAVTDFLGRMRLVATVARPWVRRPNHGLATVATTLAEIRVGQGGAWGAVPTAAAADAVDVQATLAGDGESYARLIRRHQPAVAAYLWKFTRDRQQWEELVHDVFVEAYFSLGKYAGRAPLVHWLKRIATRVGYRHWRTRRRRREVPFPDDPDQLGAVAEDSTAAWQAGELVHRLLGELAPRDRLVMTLTYLESCRVAEIAALTGWSETMVKVQTHRARKRLAKICRNLGIEL
jgi:RNA polymerase sigma-70 factor, ECF subfamily